MLRNIWKVREILYCLVRRDLIVRYQSSLLGFFWSFVKPLVLVAIFGVAFGVVFRVPLPNKSVPFPLHLVVGILAWSFLARCVTEGHYSILGHANLIKKVKLPVEVFPAVTVVGNLINYLLGMLVVFPLVLVVMWKRIDMVGWEISVQVVLFLLVTLLLAFFAFALTLLVSALNVFYRDMESLTEIGLQAWFYATPIVYAGSLLYQHNVFSILGARYAPVLEILYWLNPMTPICAAYRRILLYRPIQGSTDLFGGLEVSDKSLMLYLAVSVVVTALLFALAKRIFYHYARFFADEV
jgi:lipopolysaccharide transport system permease protein